MTKITRRGFIGTSLAIAGAAAVSRWPMDVNALPAPAKGKLPLGFQVWTINADLQKDFAGTLAKMAGLGYKTVEMCSPPATAGNPWNTSSRRKCGRSSGMPDWTWQAPTMG